MCNYTINCAVNDLLPEIHLSDIFTMTATWVLLRCADLFLKNGQYKDVSQTPVAKKLEDYL